MWIDEPGTTRNQPSPPWQGTAAPPTTEASAPRPWYKKKRFLVPVGLVLAIFFFASLGGGDEGGREVAGPDSATQVDEVAPDEASAEDVAAEEEAERVAAEQEAAEQAAQAEADRLAAEQAAAAAAAAEAARGTVSQQNAYRSATSYLGLKGFSRAGLIEQLTSEYGEEFPPADAEFAVARLESEGGVDWNAEAAESAKSYLELTSFSRQGLIEQLTSEYGDQFTLEQAEFGVSQVGL